MEEKLLLKRDRKWGWLFVTPYILGLLMFTLVPVVASMYYSFTEYNMISAPKWVGLANYVDIFTEPDILEAYRNTFAFVLAYLPIEIFLACVLAVALNQKMRCITLFRGIYFMPVVAPMVAVASIWVMLYNPYGGIFNQIFNLFGMGPFKYVFSDKWYVIIISIAALCIWKGVGSEAIYLLAALQGVSNDIYEAADIDGAGTVTKFFKITIPMLSPTIFYLVMVGMIGTFNSFEIFKTMTQEGAELPVVATYVYNAAFGTTAKIGRATAIGWVTFIIVGILTVIQKKAEKRWVYYE